MEIENLLIGVTGSVASIKLPLLVKEFKSIKPSIQIKVVPTQHSKHFFKTNEVDAELLSDSDEWTSWSSLNDDVLHIELRRWADALVIAPLDANTLAKMSHGICDNLLTCVVRAWDIKKPLYFAPAMNTHMWDHPFTRKHINILKELGYKEIPPVVKRLACGDFGEGGMAAVQDIANVVIKRE